MTETLAERLLRHEGLRTVCYNDSLGFKTIGCGHRVTAADGDRFDTGLTYDQALELLNDDIAKARAAVIKAIPRTYDMLDDLRKDIVVEMAFQLGIQGLLEFRVFLTDLRAEDWPNAAKEMLKSKWAEQTPGRCEELAALMLNGAETD